MRELGLIAISLLALLSLTGQHADAAVAHHHPTGIRKVVVLMEENRSFDHMFGWLKRTRPEVDGLTGKEYNLMNTSDPSSQRFYVDDTAPYISPYDPCHLFIPCVTTQIFGNGPQTVSPAPMSGFAEVSAVERFGDPGVVMNMFTPKTVPIIHALAEEFALFDSWFSSFPGHTNPNRRFLHAATACGSQDNEDWYSEGFPCRTFFDELSDANRSWTVYYNDWSDLCMFKSLRTPEALAHFKFFDQFYVDTAAGTLADYVFVVPRMFPTDTLVADDQHPDHAVDAGERLMKKMYETLRASPHWEELLFIITYDEHGGFYDHVPPPSNVPNPDGLNSTMPPFDFTRLGVRVPTVMISPWINKGVLVHEPAHEDRPFPDSVFEHSSVPATVKQLFGLPNFLTKRDAWAATFMHLLTQRSEPRTDCPTTLPDVPPQAPHDLVAEQISPPNDLQLDYLRQVNTCNPPASLADAANNVRRFTTQLEAGRHIRQQFDDLVARSAASVAAAAGARH